MVMESYGLIRIRQDKRRVQRPNYQMVVGGRESRRKTNDASDEEIGGNRPTVLSLIWRSSWAVSRSLISYLVAIRISHIASYPSCLPNRMPGQVDALVKLFGWPAGRDHIASHRIAFMSNCSSAVQTSSHTKTEMCVWADVALRPRNMFLFAPDRMQINTIFWAKFPSWAFMLKYEIVHLSMKPLNYYWKPSMKFVLSWSAAKVHLHENSSFIPNLLIHEC
jgi:hypothetical protein